MNTEERGQILQKFYYNLQKKSLSIGRRKSSRNNVIQTLSQMKSSIPSLQLLNSNNLLEVQLKISENNEQKEKSLKLFKQKQLLNENNENKFLQELISHQSHITNIIQTTHSKIYKVLQQITTLKNRKQNTQKLMDAMTSILQLKRLAYGFWTTDDQQNFDLPQCQEVLKNLTSYYQVKGKSFYCQSLIQMIQINIKDIQKKFKEIFQKQLGRASGQSQSKRSVDKYGGNTISTVAKILQLIAKNSKPVHKANYKQENNQNKPHSIVQKELSDITNTHRQLCKFYKDLIKKQFDIIQQQLFKIPVVGNSFQSVYIFFDLAKNVMKIIVTLITTYRTNIIRVSSFEGLAEMIVQIFTFSLENIILQILRRQIAYFQIDKINIDHKKLSINQSSFQRLTHYFNEFNAIWNQIQRLRYHLEQQITEEEFQNSNCKDPAGFLKTYILKLQNSINGQKFIQFNSNIILYMQAYQRHQFDKLLRKSPFINSMWQQNPAFFKPYESIVNKKEGNITPDNKLRQCSQGLDFIEETITMFQKGIQKSFQTLNILIVSALINFTNHNLVHEDMFYAFNQLFNRLINKIPNKVDNVQYLIRPSIGIIIIFNLLASIPNALRSFQTIQIPQLLPNYDRIKIELAQLVTNNQDKARQFTSNLIDKIVCKEGEVLATQIMNLNDKQQKQIFKKMINKWDNLLDPTIYQILIKKFAIMHVQLLQSKYFSLDSFFVKDRKYDQKTVMDLEKQLRNIMSFYDSKTLKSNLQAFKRILTFVQVLIAENEQQFNQLLQSLKGKYQQDELRKIWKMKINK